MSKKYVKVRTTQVFYHTYLMEMPKGQTPESMKDAVVCDQVDEFSQQWLGENIIDAIELTEAELLAEVANEKMWSFSKTDKDRINLIKRLGKRMDV